MWSELKRKVHMHSPENVKEVEMFRMEACLQVSIKSSNKRLSGVIQSQILIVDDVG